ncbi:MAG: hypothetical protein LBS60_02595 [Deltaproteobacteria bacterium]|nr:hypothetical protein [Deltaproteobacteria bacterium]
MVDKIRFVKKDAKTAIQRDLFITISNIPRKAYEYAVNGRFSCCMDT